MVQLGNHLKMNLPVPLRERAREFYAGLLECKAMESPRPDLDLYEFAGGVVLGLFFVDATDALSEADCLKATWLELKVDDPARWKARLQAFGVREVEFPDPTRFFFQAPGGAVFRLAPMDGGL
jgi:catechol 2,3-dioxygenase-like lactoylglutathione lyase family enzyme